MDFLRVLDPSKLVLAEAVSHTHSSLKRSQLISYQGLAFFTSIFNDSPSYNLPILLFGLYAQENAEAIQSLQFVSFVQFMGSRLLLPTVQLVHRDPWCLDDF